MEKTQHEELLRRTKTKIFEQQIISGFKEVFSSKQSDSPIMEINLNNLNYFFSYELTPLDFQNIANG